MSIEDDIRKGAEQARRQKEHEQQQAAEQARQAAQRAERATTRGCTWNGTGTPHEASTARK
jgi:hypothetical protein